jgi:uncharacterized membrane protein YozB (DUF420 family)
MDLSFLPAVNASLNALAGVLLVVAYVLIKQGRRDAHRNVMLAAFATSGLFLVCYVTHYVWRASVKGGVHTAYNGQGVIRTAYYLMLLTHILLAMVVPVAAVVLIGLGLKGRYEWHRRIGRVALPIWLYVSVTGVLIYFMLYHFNPQA